MGRPTSAPAYADLRWADVWPDQDNLVVRLELDGAVPPPLDPATATVSFIVLLDRDGDERADHRVEVSSADAWNVDVWDASTGLIRRSGTAHFGQSSVRFRVPLAWLAFRGVVRYHVVVRWRERPEPSTPWTMAEDRVPNEDSRWIRVGSFVKP